MADTASNWDVLNVKVELQGKQIESLADDTARQFVEFRETTQAHLSAMRGESKTEFERLNKSIEALVTGIQTRDREKDKESKTSWISLVGTGLTAIAITSGLIGTLATLRLTPIENDVKSTKDNISSIVTALEKITTKLDNFETRSEITERNRSVDAALTERKATADHLEETKVSKTELASLNHERDAQVARLQQDIAENKQVSENQAEQIVTLRIANAKIEALYDARTKTIDRINTDLDRRATTEALDGIRLRLTDQRDRTNLLSNRVQEIYSKSFATPRDPCLDSGAGCQPKSAPAAAPTTER